MLPIFWQDARMSMPLLIQFLLCPLVLITLFRVTAPYGRHHQSGWGPTLPGRLAWFIMELPALLVVPWMVLTSGAHGTAAALVPALLWLFHYGYRALVFPALMHASDRTFPALLAVFAIGFNLLNGYNNGSALIANGEIGTSLWTLHFSLGLLVFAAGFLTHFQADRTIRKLRRPGETGYRIPQGGLFRWVSSPHYLGEIVQWAGWAIMTWSLAGLAFALFTACNLVPRAVSNHRWYLRQFPDYPPERRVLLPGLF